jgi:hypothetical protein
LTTLAMSQAQMFFKIVESDIADEQITALMDALYYSAEEPMNGSLTFELLKHQKRSLEAYIPRFKRKGSSALAPLRQHYPWVRLHHLVDTYLTFASQMITRLTDVELLTPLIRRQLVSTAGEDLERMIREKKYRFLSRESGELTPLERIVLKDQNFADIQG